VLRRTLFPYSKFLWFYEGYKEVDFVFKRDDGTFLGIESKYKPGIQPKDMPSIGLNSILLTKEDYLEKEDLIAVPASTFLFLLKKSRPNL
jgi:predicted AAA+ superfamily ATPase